MKKLLLRSLLLSSLVLNWNQMYSQQLNISAGYGIPTGNFIETSTFFFDVYNNANAFENRTSLYLDVAYQFPISGRMNIGFGLQYIYASIDYLDTNDVDVNSDELLTSSFRNFLNPVIFLHYNYPIGEVSGISAGINVQLPITLHSERSKIGLDGNSVTNGPLRNSVYYGFGAEIIYHFKPSDRLGYFAKVGYNFHYIKPALGLSQLMVVGVGVNYYLNT